jgi:AAA domain-containing protein
VQIVTIDQRVQEQRGVTICLAGIPGIGKTSQARTLRDRLPKSLLINCEAGDLAIADVPIHAIHEPTWEELRDIALILGGPDPVQAPSEPYSKARYDALIAEPECAKLATYETVVIDSLTEVSRRSFAFAERQPEAFSHGRKDLRGCYGLHARQMIGWLSRLQRDRRRNIIMTCVLERSVDNLGTATWDLQTEGQRFNRELPAVVDEVIVLAFVDFGDAKPVRAFICNQPNIWNYPSKDRSGRLDLYEKPDLGALLDKLLNYGGQQHA